MVNMTVRYEGELRCSAQHGPSGSRVETDAPADNCGRGERFSPTDLMAVGVASCMATTLAIMARKKGWPALDGIRVEITKVMSSEPPRRIVRVPAELWMPVRLDPAAMQEAEAIARGCPAYRSLHPDIEAPVTIHWPEA